MQDAAALLSGWERQGEGLIYAVASAAPLKCARNQQSNAGRGYARSCSSRHPRELRVEERRIAGYSS